MSLNPSLASAKPRRSPIIRTVAYPSSRSNITADREKPCPQLGQSKFTFGGSPVAPLTKELAYGAKFLHSVIANVGYENNSGPARSDPARRVELNIVAALGTPLGNEIPTGGESLYAIIASVGNKEVTSPSTAIPLGESNSPSLLPLAPTLSMNPPPVVNLCTRWFPVSAT